MGPWQLAAHVITTTGLVVIAYWTYKGKLLTSKVNDAVNNVHPTAPRLADRVMNIHETMHTVSQHLASIDEKLGEVLIWKRGYEGGPLDNGQKVVQFVTETQADLQVIKDMLSTAQYGDRKSGTQKRPTRPPKRPS